MASLSCSRVNREDAGRAVDALLNFLHSQAKKRKGQLFEHDDLLYLNLAVRRYPSTSHLSPYRIPLPHTLHPLDPTRTSLCLIVNDSLVDSVRSTAASQKLPVDAVISLSELRTDYVAFESRRRLCNSYDIFFTDRRITPILPHLMGNFFFKKKKFPLAIDMDRQWWPEAIRRACSCSLLYIRAGTCSVLKVGRISMDREQILDNLFAVIEGAVNHVPKKWANVRSLHIRAAQSVALPIYQVLPELGMKIDVGVQEGDVKQGELERKPKKHKRSKKVKGRIHEVNYINFDVEVGVGEEHEHGSEDGDSDELCMMKKAKKNNVEKGEKSRAAGNNEDDAKENKSGDESTGKRKKRKRTQKIINDKDEGFTTAADDGDIGEGEELHLKRRAKKVVKERKDKKGKLGIHQGNTGTCTGIGDDEGEDGTVRKKKKKKKSKALNSFNAA